MKCSVNVHWVLLSSSKPLLAFCLLVITIIDKMVFKYPNIITDLFFLLSVLLVFILCIFHLCCLVHTHLGFLCLYGGLILLSLYNSLSLPGNFLCSTVYIFINSHSTEFQKPQRSLNFVVLSTKQTSGNRGSLLFTWITVLRPPYCLYNRAFWENLGTP